MKSWLKSKTIIVNSLTLAASVLTLLVGSELVQQNPKITAGIVAALAAVNVGLRIITSVPIG